MTLSRLIGTWEDITGGGLDLVQSDGQSKPYLDRFAADGSPCAEFDGNDSLTSLQDLPGGSMTRVVQMRVDDPTLGGHLMGAGNGDGLRLLPGLPRLVFEQGGVRVMSGAALPLGKQVTVLVTFNERSGAAELFIDNILVGQGTVPALGDPTLSVGATKKGGQALRGGIAEIMILDHAVSQTERDEIHQDLSHYSGDLFPDVAIDGLPKDGAIIPRNKTNRAPVRITGSVYTVGFDVIGLRVIQGGVLFDTQVQSLSYGADGATFDLTSWIDAGLVDYDVEVFLDSPAGPTMIDARQSVACGDAFVIDGQSNAVAKDWHQEGLGDVSQSHWIRSFGSGTYAVGFLPPILADKAEHNKDMHWDIARSLVPHSHVTIGQWALRMAEVLQLQQGVPIAIINGGLEASSIGSHQRNDFYPTDPQSLYGRLLKRAQEAGIDQGVRALFYFQGEADAYKGPWWAQQWDNMYWDWHEDYPNLEQIYAFQIRDGCNIFGWSVREEQRRLDFKYPDVSVMSTTSVPTHDICHWYYVGYREIGNRIARMVARDLYGQPGSNINPPMIAHAKYAGGSKSQLRLTFLPGGDTLFVDPGVQAYFLLDDGTKVTGATTTGSNQLVLDLAGPSTAQTVSWIGHPYDGPWVSNANGVGALTFFGFPIEN